MARIKVKKSNVNVKIKESKDEKPPKAKVKKIISTVVVNENIDCGFF